MSIFKSKFGILKDVRPVPDPFGCGVTFLIRRKGHPAYKAFAASLTEGSELSRAFGIELGKQQMKAQMTGKKVDKEAAIDRAFDKVAFDPKSSADFITTNRTRVAHLLDGWEGEDVEFSIDAAVEMFSLENPLDESVPFARKEIDLDEDELAAERERAAREGREPKTTRTLKRNLGEALMAFIEEEADREEAYLEALGKNSAASSAGVPASSAD